MKKIKSEKGAIAALVVVTVLMFALILMGTYMAITNLRKSQLESDIRIQQLYGGDVERIEEVYNTVVKNITAGLEVGDYINYDSGENGIITCRVLYEADSEYGLQIISDKSVKNVTLGGNTFEEARTSYNNGIETLNNEAEKYINTNYVTDARCVGSMPTVEEGIFTRKNSKSEKTVSLPPSEWSSYIRPSGWTSDDTGCYAADANYSADQMQMESLGIWITGEEYWMASHGVYPLSNDCYFDVRYVLGADGVYSYYLCSVNSQGYIYGASHEFGLRPCFSLKTDIKITGGDGSQENPYTM